MQAKPKTPTRLALAAAALLLALPLAGCVENVNDLKDALSGATGDETLDASALPSDDPQSGLPPASVTNVTKAAKPPVARIAVYGDGGALAFKSGFAADETVIPTVFDGGSTVTFSASGSEAVDARATLETYTWTVASLSASKQEAASGGDGHDDHAHALVGLSEDAEGHDEHAGSGMAAEGGHDMTGVSVQHTFPEEGGVFLVTLTVEDSLGGKDAQAVKVGVNPAQVVKSVTFQGTVQAGHAYTLPGEVPATPDTSAHVFNVSDAVNDLPAKAVSAVLRLAPSGATGVDLDLAVNDPAGNEAGSAATGSAGETLTLADLGAGDWQAVVTANLGVAADYTLVVEVTYQPEHPDVVATFGGGGDGHAH